MTCGMFWILTADCWQCSDGVLVDRQLCAARHGTTVLIEDLFYNFPARQKALSAGNSEYIRILNVVSQYAVFHTSVGFSVRRVGRHPDLHTPPGATRLETIRFIAFQNLLLSHC